MTETVKEDESVIPSTEKASNNPLEQFVLLAKTAKDAAAVEIIKQVIETPGIYVFRELLDMPNINDLVSSPEYHEYWYTLTLFAYGIYTDYINNRELFIKLTPVQQKKLQYLTIVSLAEKSKCIPYSELLEKLDIKNVRDLEDLIIEAVYADIIHGKLDQKNSQLEVDYAGLGRDVVPGGTCAIIETLTLWGDTCNTVLACIEDQVKKANNEKHLATQHRDQLQQNIALIKKTTIAQVQEADVAGGSSGGADLNREAMSIPLESKKKQQKTKGIRGSGKFWK